MTTFLDSENQATGPKVFYRMCPVDMHIGCPIFNNSGLNTAARIWLTILPDSQYSQPSLQLSLPWCSMLTCQKISLGVATTSMTRDRFPKYLDFTQLLDNIIQSGICFINIKQWLLFNLKQEKLAVFSHLMFSQIPVVKDSCWNDVLFILMALKAIVTGIICTNFKLSIDHPYMEQKQCIIIWPHIGL